MTISTPLTAAQASHTPVRAAILATAVAAAITLNLVVAAIAVALGVPAGYGPLSAPALIIFSVVPITVGWFGWRLVERRAGRPQRTLGVLVAVVLLLSFVPDVVLLATGFVPGTTPLAVGALMVTHLVVMGAGVTGYVLASRR